MTNIMESVGEALSLAMQYGLERDALQSELAAAVTRISVLERQCAELLETIADLQDELAMEVAS